ncbi:uncharacterized protein LOC125680655 [Ostrea edulis]|uniref:uncharacterized protein LOC125680655 n=1 Tax=Ostrea edulis TaxID=37623 RepID=UPI0024AFC49B|nr:uncharacterized protein LOC125680655 [Ostrea edulis]
MYLRQNDIKEIPQKAFSNLVHLRYQYMDGNPVLCDCNIKWLLYSYRMRYLKVNAICSAPAYMKGKWLHRLQLSHIRCDCRIPGQLYGGKRNKTISGKPCKTWKKATTNQTKYDEMVKSQENHCTNLYADEPVCFPRKQSDLMSCDVPICSDNPCINDEFLEKRYGFVSLYSRLQCIYRELTSLVPPSLLHCGLAQSLVKTIQVKKIRCPDKRTMTRALTLQTDDSKQMFEKCYLLENNQREPLTKRMQKDQFCLKHLKTIFFSETREQFCRSVSVFVNCKLSQLMEITDETITEYDKNFVSSRLQRELQHTGFKQYNCEAYQ